MASVTAPLPQHMPQAGLECEEGGFSKQQTVDRTDFNRRKKVIQSCAIVLVFGTAFAMGFFFLGPLVAGHQTGNLDQAAANQYRFVGGVPRVTRSRMAPNAMMAKGFGKKDPPSAPKKKRTPYTPYTPPAAPAQASKTAKAAKDFDALKESGAPEYVISVRTVGDSGTSDWYPVGGLAVPRSNSIDTAVSMAIFNNEDDLLKGAFQAYPKLKSSTEKFEYGYRLAEFPDDEVKVAKKDAIKESTNPIMAWFNQLDSPLNKD